MQSDYKYYIAYDPCNELNWWQKLLKKIGFYKNRPKFEYTIFKHHPDGTVEVVKSKQKW